MPRTINPCLFIGVGELGKEAIQLLVRSAKIYGEKYLKYHRFISLERSGGYFEFYPEIISYYEEKEYLSREENYSNFQKSLEKKFEELKAIAPKENDDVILDGISAGSPQRRIFAIFIISLDDEEFSEKYLDSFLKSTFFKNCYHIYFIKCDNPSTKKNPFSDESIDQIIRGVEGEEEQRKKVFIFSSTSDEAETILKTNYDWSVFFKEILEIYYYVDLVANQKRAYYLHNRQNLNTIGIKIYNSYAELFYHYFVHNSLGKYLENSIKPIKVVDPIQENAKALVNDEILSRLDFVDYLKKIKMDDIDWDITNDPTIVDNWIMIISKIDSIIGKLIETKDEKILEKLKKPDRKFSEIGYDILTKAKDRIEASIKEETNHFFNGLRKGEKLLDEINNYIDKALKSITIDWSFKSRFETLFSEKIQALEKLKAQKYIPPFNKGLYITLAFILTCLFSLSFSSLIRITFSTDKSFNFLATTGICAAVLGIWFYFRYKKILSKIEREKREFLENLNIAVKDITKATIGLMNRFGEVITGFWKKKILISLKKRNELKLRLINGVFKIIENAFTYFDSISKRDLKEIEGETKLNRFIFKYDQHRKNYEHGKRIQEDFFKSIEQEHIPFNLERDLEEVLGWEQMAKTYIENCIAKFNEIFMKILAYEMDIEGLLQDDISVAVPLKLKKQVPVNYIFTNGDWRKDFKMNDIIKKFLADYETYAIELYRKDKLVASKIVEGLKIEFGN